ncbi:MAG: sodium-dependent transporter, partial [Nevskiales bacterium]
MGKGFMDWMEYLSVTIMLPTGALLTALFVGWRLGPKAVKAITNDGTLAIPGLGLWLFVLRFIAPLGILWILISGLS